MEPPAARRSGSSDCAAGRGRSARRAASASRPAGRARLMADSIGPIPLPAAGEKASGYFTFDDPQLARYQWPYFAVVGSQPGRTFVLTAGIHAAEYTGILAAIRLGRWLDPVQVKGTIAIIPLLNRP